MMSDGDAIELQSSKSLPPETDKGSVGEPLVDSESSHDISGRSSARSLEPSYVETPENKGHSRKKGFRCILSLIPRIPPLIRHLALVHLPPVAITLAVLSLYIASVRWSNPTNNALNALQFAAKIHEALIIVSIGDILLGRISHHLLNKGNSLPLGYLPSAFLLNSPFLYLISSELWAPILSSRGQYRARKATGAMIFLSAVLCIAASPLSAITMIPRQGWRVIPYPVLYGVDGKLITYTTGTLYNSDLGVESIPDHNVTQGSSWFSRPSQRSILETTIRLRTYPYGLLTNVTYSNFGATRRPMSYGSLLPRGTFATCPPSVVASYLGSGYHGSAGMVKAVNKEAGTSMLKRWKQPLVVTECTSGSLDDEGIADFVFTIPYFNGSVESFPSIHIDSSQHPWLLNVAKTTSKSPGPLGYSFLNIKDAMGLPISTDIMFASAINETTDAEGYVTPLQPPEIRFTLCLIYARWAEADIWIEPHKSRDALSHIIVAKGEDVTNITEYFGTRDFINIQEEWMAGIGAVSTTSANISSYEEAMDFCKIGLVLEGRYATDCLESFLAMHVTDAIAELGEFQIGPHVDTIQAYEEANVVVYTRYDYMYFYGFGSSIGIPIAFSILLFHVLIVLVYITLLFFSEHLQNRPGWSSLGDLLVLTLSSDVEVDLTKGKASEKWTKPVVVRDLGHPGRKDIVVRDNGDDMD